MNYLRFKKQMETKNRDYPEHDDKLKEAATRVRVLRSDRVIVRIMKGIGRIFIAKDIKNN